MSISSGLNRIAEFFGGGEPSPEEQTELFQQAVLMTLARATSADTNIKAVEVEMVRDVIERITGESVTDADVRLAAKSKLYESAPLERYLSGVARKLPSEDRVTIVEALAEVIRSDERISSLEIDFFNTVAGALDVTPAELAGLFAAE